MILENSCINVYKNNDLYDNSSMVLRAYIFVR